jgi:hypothetical protein
MVEVLDVQDKSVVSGNPRSSIPETTKNLGQIELGQNFSGQLYDVFDPKSLSEKLWRLK